MAEGEGVKWGGMHGEETRLWEEGSRPCGKSLRGRIPGGRKYHVTGEKEKSLLKWRKNEPTTKFAKR